MKKLIVSLLAALLLTVIVPPNLSAEDKKIETSIVATNTESAEASALIARLTEIKSMDKSKLSSSEKRELRKEVRSTKKKLKELNDGIYLSFGAVIIIAILLIILL